MANTDSCLNNVIYTYTQAIICLKCCLKYISARFTRSVDLYYNLDVLSKEFVTALYRKHYLPESLTPRGHSGVSVRCRSLGTEAPLLVRRCAAEDGELRLRPYGESSNTESRSSIIIFELNLLQTTS